MKSVDGALFNEDQRDVCQLMDALDPLKDLVDKCGCQPHRSLIQEQKLRQGDKTAADRQHTHAAEHGYDECLRRRMQAEDRVGRHNQEHDRIETADPAGHGAVDGDCPELPGHAVDTRSFSCKLILLDRK
jgi:hypothetical protein